MIRQNEFQTNIDGSIDEQIDGDFQPATLFERTGITNRDDVCMSRVTARCQSHDPGFQRSFDQGGSPVLLRMFLNILRNGVLNGLFQKRSSLNVIVDISIFDRGGNREDLLLPCKGVGSPNLIGSMNQGRTLLEAELIDFVIGDSISFSFDDRAKNIVLHADFPESALFQLTDHQLITDPISHIGKKTDPVPVIKHVGNVGIQAEVLRQINSLAGRSPIGINDRKNGGIADGAGGWGVVGGGRGRAQSGNLQKQV